MEWKKNHNNDYYIQHFQAEVLDGLDAINVILDFSRMAYGFNVGENDIALICYEKPSDFCHRHLLTEWLNQNGFVNGYKSWTVTLFTNINVTVHKE